LVKVSAGDSDRWVSNPDADCWAVLFYGPNDGLVRVRARSVVEKTTGGAADDPFGVYLSDDAGRAGAPSALNDEAFSMSLVGGQRVVWVREATDKLASDFDGILGGDVRPNFIVVEAGNLTPRAKLRALFEKSKNAAAIGCYDDDERTLMGFVGARFRDHGIQADRAAMEALVSRLSTDRLSNISEIDKLCLLVGEGGTLDEDTVLTSVGDAAAGVADECIFAVFDGDRAGADRLMARCLEDGIVPVQLARRFQGHLERLMLVRARMDEGQSMQQAMAKLQPRVFFKYEKRFQGQASRWSGVDLERCLDALVELEIACKSTGMPDAALCQRMALSVSGLAAQGRRR
jgi:DNA polymerase-3 subunit delta